MNCWLIGLVEAELSGTGYMKAEEDGFVDSCWWTAYPEDDGDGGWRFAEGKSGSLRERGSR